MPQMSRAAASGAMPTHAHPSAVLLRSLVIGLTAFLTVVDLFATQAILPSLTTAYGVTPAAMGFAVNASTWEWRSPASAWRSSANGSTAGSVS
jgi:YNFM family putative membrane transporter